jgi:hypothetical protein
VSTSCVATFEPRPSSIGVFNPTTHDWQLKRTLAKTNGGCDTDSCINPWEKNKIPARRSHWIPVVGDWNGSGADALGIYSPTNSDSRASRWYLDHNGNEKWNGCENDRCLRDFGQRGDLPVVGDWSGTGRWKIGVFRPSTGEWFLDLEAARKFDGCTVDRCVVSFGQHRDLPVTGDWNASGISNIGLFRPNTGEWFLDLTETAYAMVATLINASPASASQAIYRWLVIGTLPARARSACSDRQLENGFWI